MSTTSQTTAPEPQMPELPVAAAPVSNKRSAATGVIPKQMQSWILLSVLLVGAVGLWFSSGTTKAAKPSPGMVSSTADQVKPPVSGLSPDEVQTRLKENEEASRNAAANPRTNTPTAIDGQFKDLFGDPGKAANDAQNPLQNPPRDPIQEEERKREYLGRFSSNIALSYRSDPRAGTLGSPMKSGELPIAANPQAALPGLPADFQQQLDLLQAQQEKLLAQQQQQLAAAATLSGAAPTQLQPQTQAAPAAAHRNA